MKVKAKILLTTMDTEEILTIMLASPENNTIHMIERVVLAEATN